MKTSFAAAVIIFAVSFSFSADNSDFKRGAAAYISGNTEEAMILLYKAHLAYPSDKKTKALLAEVYLDKAAQDMTDGDYVSASKYINEAEKLKVIQAQVSRVKQSLKAITSKEKAAITRKRKKAKTPKKRRTPAPVKVKKRAKITEKPKTRSQAKAPAARVSPIIIKERVIENPGAAMNWKKQSAIAAGVLIPIIAAAFIFLKLFLNERVKEAELLEEKQIAEKRLRKEVDSLKETAVKLKTSLADEKKKKNQASALSYNRQTDSGHAIKEENKKLQRRLEKMEGYLQNLQTAGRETVNKETAHPAEKFAHARGGINFLPEYTEIPLSTSSLVRMLKGASELSARLNLLWALGNKTGLDAVKILEQQASAAKGEEYREILKSLKKISLRPETPPEVKTKVEAIFRGLRRKGTII
ncbi:MAG: hypothetical protein U9O97_06005 [Elusimicrobiota bacterium]|nr:hypothetical protein [Elusimicrobiota bacterium]